MMWLGGGFVKKEINTARVKLIIIPTKTVRAGEIPRNQFSEKFRSGERNLKNII